VSGVIASMRDKRTGKLKNLGFVEDHRVETMADEEA
jgi:hypothetical protein